MDNKKDDPLTHPLVLGLFIFILLLILLFGAVFVTFQFLTSK